MTPADPLVSVLLPTYNRAQWLARAIDSVLAQTYAPLELVVVDDGSTDATSEVLDGYGARIVRLRQARGGAYAARNLALSRAQGALIALMDSDDAWLPDKLARQVARFAAPDVGVVFGDAVHVHPGPAGVVCSGRTCFGTTAPARGDVAPHLVWGNFVPTVTAVVRRSCLDAVGGFPTSHLVSADYLTWYRLALGTQFDFVPEVVAEYTVHPAGISQDLVRALRARVELFHAELQRTDGPSEQAVLRRLLFCLGVSLLVAVCRGPAGARAQPTREAWRALRVARPREALLCVVVMILRRAAPMGWRPHADQP